MWIVLYNMYMNERRGMSMKYKLIALDMDGTLLDENLKISDENIYWIKKAMEHDVIVILSTGRGYKNAIDFADELQLNTPMITVNGSEIWETPRKLLARTLMDSKHIEKLFELSKKNDDMWFWAYTSNSVLFNRDNWHEVTKPVSQYEWLKFGYYSENISLLHAVRDEIASWNELEITNSSEFNIELNAKGISKASALQKLSKHLNITMDEVIAMGDSLNDIKAIETVGMGVAMGNAQEPVKQAANYVTDTNNEHGVAKAIAHLVFNTTIDKKL